MSEVTSGQTSGRGTPRSTPRNAKQDESEEPRMLFDSEILREKGTMDANFIVIKSKRQPDMKQLQNTLNTGKGLSEKKIKDRQN